MHPMIPVAQASQYLDDIEITLSLVMRVRAEGALGLLTLCGVR